jgi:hypothetical protein
VATHRAPGHLGEHLFGKLRHGSSCGDHGGGPARLAPACSLERGAGKIVKPDTQGPAPAGSPPATSFDGREWVI